MRRSYTYAYRLVDGGFREIQMTSTIICITTDRSCPNKEKITYKENNKGEDKKYALRNSSINWMEQDE